MADHLPPLPRATWPGGFAGQIGCDAYTAAQMRAYAEQHAAMLRAERDAARRECSEALRLVADIRAAIGDDGLRMQDELIEWLRAERADLARLRWAMRFIASHAWDDRTSDAAARSLIRHHPAVEAAREETPQ